jgi:hypothetical protein
MEPPDLDSGSAKKQRNKNERGMGEKKKNGKNAGKICENIGLYKRLYDYSHQDPNRNEKKTNKKRQRKLQMDKKKD